MKNPIKNFNEWLAESKSHKKSNSFDNSDPESGEDAYEWLMDALAEDIEITDEENKELHNSSIEDVVNFINSKLTKYKVNIEEGEESTNLTIVPLSNEQLVESKSNESDKKADKQKITFEFEYDWTQADQMSKIEAKEFLMDELKSLPTNATVIGKPTLVGWGRPRGGEPKYWDPYTAEVVVSFTGSKSEIMKWAKSISLDMIGHEIG